MAKFGNGGARILEFSPESRVVRGMSVCFEQAVVGHELEFIVEYKRMAPG